MIDVSADQPRPDPADGLTLIRASELSQFSFCQRAWWLSTVKQISPRNQGVMNYGTRFHRVHTRQVYSAVRWRNASFFLLASGLSLLALVTLWYFL